MDHGSVVVATAPPVIPSLFTTTEVARMLKVSQRTVQDWVLSL